MNDDDEKFCTNLHLYLRDFKCSADVISEQLGLKPTESWIDGELIPGRKGGVRYKGNAWHLTSPLEGKNRRSMEQVNVFLQMLESKQKIIKRLSNEMDVLVLFGVYGFDCSPPVELSAEAIHFISSIGARMEIDTFDFSRSPPNDVEADERYRTNLFFCLHDFECSVDDISEQLGLQPTGSWIDGELIPGRKGGECYKKNTWQLTSPLEAKNHNPAEQINALSHVLEGKEKIIKNLSNDTDVLLKFDVNGFNYIPEFEASPAAIEFISSLGARVKAYLHDFSRPRDDDEDGDCNAT